jgi:hypothetical protein
VRRSLILGLALALVGCRAAAERVALQPLPEDAAPLPFADLVSRARLQAMTANEAFYVDHWADLENAARGIEQSARFVKRATAVPADKQGELSLRADRLAREAVQLREAAVAHDADRVNSILQRIHSQVRELR